MNWTGVTNTPTFQTTANGILNIYGSLTLVSNMTLNYNSDFYFEATTTGQTITCAGQNLPIIYLNGIGAGFTLSDDYFGAAIFITNGSFSTASHTVNSGVFYNSTGTLDISNSTINCMTGGFTDHGSGPLLATNSVINCGNFDMGGGIARTYNDVNSTGSLQAITGPSATVFHDVTCGLAIMIDGATFQIYC